MKEQIHINFDASEFEGFEDIIEYFRYRSRTLKDDQGRKFKQEYQAADMGMSPPQWSQKINESNNTTITLREAVKFSLVFNDRGWLDFAEWLWLERNKDDVDALIKQRAELDRLIEQKTKK